MTIDNIIPTLGTIPGRIKKTIEQLQNKNDHCEIKSLAIAATLKNGDVLHGVLVDDDGRPFTLLGVMDLLKDKIIEEHIEK